MNRIKYRLKIFALLGAIWTILFPMAVLLELHAEEKKRLLFCLFFSGAVLLILCGALIRDWSLYRTARLIVENHLFFARIAEASRSGTSRIQVALPAKTVDVYISCFGILLDDQVIKFDRDGRKLREVMVGKDRIILCLQKRNDEQTFQILHPALEGTEFETFADRFYYETGIRPVRAGE